VDYAFKRLFGIDSSKPFLIDFLNAVLPLENKIVELTYLEREQLGLTPDERKAVFDVFCIDHTGRRFIIELQRLFQRFFRDRSLYYSTFPIQVQAKKGEWNFELQETITVGILDFSFDDTHPDQLIHRVRLIEEESGQVFNKNLVYVYIETSKFNKKEEELSTRLDQWLFVLIGMSKFAEIPVTLQEDEIFKHFFMTAEEANLKLAEYMEYVASQKDRWDRYAVEETAEWRGKELEKRSIAKAMKANGVSIDIIMKSTGLSEEEINKLP
jgi:predicted transposase/invertase (TIGR01784 family)